MSSPPPLFKFPRRFRTASSSPPQFYFADGQRYLRADDQPHRDRFGHGDPGGSSNLRSQFAETPTTVPEPSSLVYSASVSRCSVWSGEERVRNHGSRDLTLRRRRGLAGAGPLSRMASPRDRHDPWPALEVSRDFQAAYTHDQAGRRDRAEALYRKVLQKAPDHADALHLLGLIEHERGRHQRAIQLIRRALAIAPAFSAAHANLGSALKATGRRTEAAEAYHHAIALGSPTMLWRTATSRRFRSSGGDSQPLWRVPIARSRWRQTLSRRTSIVPTL